jgi:hypothetical protein
VPDIRNDSSKHSPMTILGFCTVLIIIACILFYFIFLQKTNFFPNKLLIIAKKIGLGLVNSIITIGIIIVLLVLGLNTFSFIPFKTLSLKKSILVQKKIFLPYYQSIKILKLKGFPQQRSNFGSFENEHKIAYFSNKWDIIVSLSQRIKKASFWIIKRNSRLQILFCVTGTSWFSLEKAKKEMIHGIHALKGAFTNYYPEILFEDLTATNIESLFEIIKSSNEGFTIKGKPATKKGSFQIERLINTIQTINDDCLFVVAIKKESKKIMNIPLRRKNQQFNSRKDFLEDHSGDSKVGIYLFTSSENSKETLMATALTIWGGTNSFQIHPLRGFKQKLVSKQLLNLNPKTTQTLSNQAINCFFHLPKKSIFTINTNKPNFNYPDFEENQFSVPVVFGNLIQNEKVLDNFTIPLKNLHYNIEIVGMIGRGKTYLVVNLLKQLLPLDIGCLIFDIKGEYSRFFAQDSETIIYTIGPPAPLGINLFRIESEEEVQNVASLICEMLTIAGSPFSPTMLSIFEGALYKISKKRTQNIHEFMECLVSSADEYAKSMRTSYARDSVDAILNRLNLIFGGINYQVFSAIENTIDYQALDEGKKIILDFSEYLRRGANSAALFLVCNLILHQLSKHASKKGITDVLRYLVVLEEAMYLIPKRFNLESTASLGYSEQNFIMGRSLGIGTISIFQLWESVSNVVHANSLTKIFFRGEDTEKMRESVILSEDQFEYVSQLPDRYCIIKSKRLSGPVLIRTKEIKRKLLNPERYREIARKKYQQIETPFRQISHSFIELKRKYFGKNKLKSKSNSRISSYIKNQSKKKDQIMEPYLKPHYMNKGSNTPLLNWEKCITFCPARLVYKEKHSSLIKNEICPFIRKMASDYTKKLLQKQSPRYFYESLQSHPIAVFQTIIKSLKKIENQQAKILAFCIVIHLLRKLNELFSFSTEKINQLLTKSRKEFYQNEVFSEYF